MKEWIGWIVGTAGTIVAIVVGILSSRRAGNESLKKDAVSLARIEDKVDTMKNGIDDIRFELRSHREKLTDINERLVRVEEGCKNAHKRIDALETSDKK